eukprot:COSAG05_NODE_1295_length_5251_cov_4.221273_1_plen_610_part_00
MQREIKQETGGSARGISAGVVACGGFVPDTLRWQDAMELLQQHSPQVVRPSRILDQACSQEQVFLERPIIKRRKGDDKWQTSGGEKGGVEHRSETGSGVFKRYGRVVRQGFAPLKFAQYSLLDRDGGSTTSTMESAGALWIIQPFAASPASAWSPADARATSPTASAAVGLPSLEHKRVFSSQGLAPDRAAVDVWSSHKFISFQSLRPDEEGMELGALDRGTDGGLKLQSSQGDFAEYYRRAPGEMPFEEGDVVGFRSGMLTRKTDGCTMVGVISRMAVVEGSGPPAKERHLYDTVAHCGLVPVKLSVRPAAGMKAAQCQCPGPQVGQVLTPSGFNDGTAVLTPATNQYLPRLGILLDTSLLDVLKSDEKEACCRLVKAAVIAPPETMRGVGKTAVQARRMVSALVILMMVFSVATLWVWKVLLAPTALPNTGSETGHKELHSSLRWGPPTLAKLTATCPDEIAACNMRGFSEGCSTIFERALRQQDVGVLYVDPGMIAEEQAVVACYFSKYPPSKSPWPPLLPDEMILHCGSWLQKCTDSPTCSKALDVALNTTDPTYLGKISPDILPLIGCTICATSIDWANNPQLVLTMEMNRNGPSRVSQSEIKH